MLVTPDVRRSEMDRLQENLLREVDGAGGRPASVTHEHLFYLNVEGDRLRGARLLDALVRREAPVVSAPTEITPDELHAAVDRIRKDRARGKVLIQITTATEVFKAVELGLVSKVEGRAMLGLKKRRGPARRVAKA